LWEVLEITVVTGVDGTVIDATVINPKAESGDGVVVDVATGEPSKGPQMTKEVRLARSVAFPHGKIRVILDGIHKCRRCERDVTSSTVPREDPGAWSNKLVLLAQAPSNCGVLVSGVHWVDREGRLRSPGGTFLDSYLRRIGYSIDPAESRLPRPYTSNVLHCWPGRGTNKNRDRPPTRKQLENCRRWWKDELEVLKPKAIVLLGKPAAHAFIDGSSLRETGETFLSLLNDQGVIAQFIWGSTHVFTVPHPTAPYNGPRGGRIAYYDHAFAALKHHLASTQPSTGDT